jgi:hypothetical protein
MFFEGNYRFTVTVTAIYALDRAMENSGLLLGSDRSVHAASQGFFACNSILNGVNQFFLK